jgi:glycosyltransferase involved in cell wall biosynthesis
MPILEAMARGVPVLTSNRSALPEVSGDAALLIDPTDTTAIAVALKRLTENPDLRTQLVQAGKHQAQKFTWRSAVNKTWGIYKELGAELTD